MDEVRTRTLYIRLPHTIHNIDEIRDLLSGDIEIKLPRQSSRHCHVIFSSVEEKIKNLKELKKKKINNKRIVTCPPRIKVKSQASKQTEKKTVIPEPKPKQKITHILYVTNIHPKTSANAIKKAMTDCKSVTFLKSDGKPVKHAIVKLTDPKISAEYLKRERPWPVINGNQLIIKPDTRKQNKKKSQLKIWDGETEITDNIHINNSDVKKDEQIKDAEKEIKNVKKKKSKKNLVSTTLIPNKEEE